MLNKEKEKMAKAFGTAKVTPTPVPPTKQNNFTSSSSGVLDQLKYLLFINALYGVNRLFLFPISKFMRISCHVYSFVIASFIVYSLVFSEDVSATYRVIKITACIEILLLMMSALMKQDSLIMYFKELAEFETLLNLNNDISLITPKYRFYAWVVGIALYSAFEFTFLSVYIHQDVELPLFFYYIAMLAHDNVCVFFWTLLRVTWLRLKIVKAHAFKILKVNEKHFRGIPDNIESLYQRAKLDVNSLHQAYDLLHRCAMRLNDSMNYSMVIMLFSSGLITTMLLKNIFKTLQTSNASDPAVKSMIIYASIRCLKYTVLVVIPCYYSSITNGEVKFIRTMLNDAVNNLELDKPSRQKMKAFFQLTQENEFAYALWGVIRLNMSLPLSYASLCATYLVIIIQFSKFID